MMFRVILKSAHCGDYESFADALKCLVSAACAQARAKATLESIYRGNWIELHDGADVYVLHMLDVIHIAHDFGLMQGGMLVEPPPHVESSALRNAFHDAHQRAMQAEMSPLMHAN